MLDAELHSTPPARGPTRGLPADAGALPLRAHTTLVDDIVITVRGLIVRGELTPGAKIRQQQLAGDLGVSRTPLREALQRLESEGWVHLAARRGAEVRPLSAAEAEEIFGMRVLLETTAARISAVTHSPGAEASAAGLIDPRRRPHARRSPTFGNEDANRRFHDLVYGLQDRSVPKELGASLVSYWTRALRYRLVYWGQRTAAGRSRDAHRAIYSAWAARDPEACEQAVARHILSALREITAQIDPDHIPGEGLQLMAARYDLHLPSDTTSP